MPMITTPSAAKPAFQPITEAAFLQDPLGPEFYMYALNVIRGFIGKENFSWNPDQTKLSLDDLIMESCLYAIELTKAEYSKGLFRNKNKNSFKNFYYTQIRKAFYEKLEKLGKYSPVKADEDEPVSSCSEEKMIALEESHEARMQYVEKILEAVSKLSPTEQRLFKLKYQIDFTDEDYRLLGKIYQQKHVRDPFAKMACEKFHLSENYAKKKICEIKKELITLLSQAGFSQERFRRETSVPVTMQMLTAGPKIPPLPAFQLDVDALTEADCREILLELTF